MQTVQNPFFKESSGNFPEDSNRCILYVCLYMNQGKQENYVSLQLDEHAFLKIYILF